MYMTISYAIIMWADMLDGTHWWFLMVMCSMMLDGVVGYYLGKEKSLTFDHGVPFLKAFMLFSVMKVVYLFALFHPLPDPNPQAPTILGVMLTFMMTWMGLFGGLFGALSVKPE